MSEVVETVQAEQPVVEETESRLPSDVAERETEQPKIDLPDGWKSVDEMAAYIKEMKDKYAQLNDKIAREKRATEADVNEVKSQVEKEALQTQTINELIPQFIENGMSLSDEMVSKLEETGLTREQIELGAYKYKEARQRNASYVGGEENFVQIMEYAKNNMSASDKESLSAIVDEFTRKGMSTQPLMLGLKAMYEQAVKPEAGNTDRVRGIPTAGGVKPYETRQELFRDRAYIQGVGKNDAGAVAKYKARLAATPDSVWMS